MTSRRGRPPGLTPIENATWTVPETGQPIPKGTKPRHRKAQLGPGNPLADRSVPAGEGLRALREEVHAPSRSELAKMAAGVRAKTLRAERDVLDDELRAARQVLKRYRAVHPGGALPASLNVRIEGLLDRIVASESELAKVRYALTGDATLATPPRALTAEQKAKVRALGKWRRSFTTEAERRREAELESARRQGRREYAAISGLLNPSPVVASSRSSSRSSLSAARADVRHPGHGPSQRVIGPDGRPGMVFTGQ